MYGSVSIIIFYSLDKVEEIFTVNCPTSNILHAFFIRTAIKTCVKLKLDDLELGASSIIIDTFLMTNKKREVEFRG